MPKYNDYGSLSRQWVESIAYTRAISEARASFGFPADLPESAAFSALLAELAAGSPQAFSVTSYSNGVNISDGIGDAAPAANACFAAALAAGADVIFPPGTYLFGSQVTATVPIDRRMSVFAHGAVFKTSGAISALSITGRGQGGGISVYGAVINHRGNGTATYGFDLNSTTGVRLIDCGVEAHGVQANYGGIILRNGTPSDDNTGSFWNEIRGFRIGKRSGADVGDIPNGIILHGQANSTAIRGGNIGGVVTNGIVIEPEIGQTSLSNGVVVDGVAFEGLTNAIKVVESDTAAVVGLRVINCRAESLTTFFNISGTSSFKTGSPTWLAANYIANISVTNYILNPGSQYVNTLDFAVTPSFTVPFLRGAKGLTVAPTTAGEHSYRAIAANNNAGYKLEDSAGTDLGSWVQRQFGGSRFRGGVNLCYFTQVASIGQTTTEGKNLRGTVTFAAATTATVTFPAAEPDANYFVVLGPYANKTFWVSGLGTGGFTINASVASSDRVDWMILR